MDPIKFAIERPIAVLAIVVMAILFGVLALNRIPVQLAPDVRRPVVAITTNWPGAAPVEVEREIVNPQEDVLRGLEGLEIMTSRARTGEAEITLEFAVGTNMSETLLLVSNRLDRVSGYPDEAGNPTLDTSGADDSPIAWVLLTAAEGNETPMAQFGDFVEDVVKDRVERVEGVSAVNVFGGVSRELQIIVHNTSTETVSIERGQRIAQLLVLSIDQLNLVEVDALPPGPDDRGADGFGSSG